MKLLHYNYSSMILLVNHLHSKRTLIATLFMVFFVFQTVPIAKAQISFDDCAKPPYSGNCISPSACKDPNESKGACYAGGAPTASICCAPKDTTKPPPSSNYTYTPLEPLFTDEKSGNFVDYMQSIYKFALWTVGIAALLMLMIGGFMYMTSAGNQANAGTAKKIITDALLGLVVVLFAWVILYLINPDLTKINLGSIANMKVRLFDHEAYTGSMGGYSSVGSPPNSGSCSEVADASSPCSAQNLSQTCFGPEKAAMLSQLCNMESGGRNPKTSIDYCITSGGRIPFSVGLFQVNLFANGALIDPSCANLGSKGTCSGPKEKGICKVGWNCKLASEADLARCSALANDVNKNIEVACKLSGNGQNLTPWACSANKCSLQGITNRVNSVCI